MQEEFSAIDHIKMAVCSWNMGGVKPYSEVDLREWLLPEISDPTELPDILVIGI